MRCELLSFNRIFGIQHNSIYFISIIYLVVNCFHLIVSLGYNTTDIINTGHTDML